METIYLETDPEGNPMVELAIDETWRGLYFAIEPQTLPQAETPAMIFLEVEEVIKFRDRLSKWIAEREERWGKR